MLCIRIPGGRIVSAEDILLIVDIFTLAQLDAVFTHLGIDYEQIQVLLQTANVLGQKVKAVLRFWLKKAGSDGTRKKMIKAITKVSQCNRSLSNLLKKWNITDVDNFPGK